MIDENKPMQYHVQQVDNELVRIHTPNGIIEITQYEHSQRTRIWLNRFGEDKPTEIVWSKILLDIGQ